MMYLAEKAKNSVVVSALHAITIAALLTWAYWPSFGGFFSRDDFRWMYAGVRGFQSIWNLFDPVLGTFRPVVALMAGVSYKLFGFSFFSHHLFQLGIHGANTFLIGYLVWKLSQERLTAMLSAFFFALHPAPATAIFWIAAKSSGLLLTSFFLLFLFCYVKVENPTGQADKKTFSWFSYLSSLAFFVVCLGTGELALIYTIIPLLYELIFFEKNLKASDRFNKALRIFLRTLPYYLISILFFYILHQNAHYTRFQGSIFDMESDFKEGWGGYIEGFLKTLAFFCFPYTFQYKFLDQPLYFYGVFVLFSFLCIIIFLISDRRSRSLILFSLAVTVITSVPFVLYHYPPQWSYHLYSIVPFFSVCMAVFTCSIARITGQTIKNFRIARYIVYLLMLSSLALVHINQIHKKYAEWESGESLEVQKTIGLQMIEILGQLKSELISTNTIILLDFPVIRSYFIFENRYSMISLMGKPGLNVEATSWIIENDTNKFIKAYDEFFQQEIKKQEGISFEPLGKILILRYHNEKVTAFWRDYDE